MTKLLPLFAAALVASAGAAAAGGFVPVVAETPVTAPAPAPVVITPQAAPSGDWTGLYLGGQLSFGQLGYERDDGDAGEADLDGAVGGLHAGYLRDFGRIVAGAEVAYDWADLKVDDEDEVTFDAGADLEGIARAGLRLGYDGGRVLPYATGGYARANLSEELAGSGEDSADGYYFGGGVEYAVTDRFSLGGEVLRHEFDLDVDGLDTGLTTVGVRAAYRF
ncbi:porin family protein [Rubellimicrobium rubrum]|uniref:Porin family protein n=1 Tax=Rubellimicrobium rubrum TaxID=2585369 RepID=A0A5C4MNX8_9RHOB|nr:porin family protein [Rubellimicrobium rubrum]TNC47301.1 porin family protein [Rubellimicrobium rubrum]